MGLLSIFRRSPSDRFRRSPHVTSVAHGDKVVLMDLRGEQFYSLDGIAVRMWDHLAEPATAEHLSDLVVQEFDVSVEVAREDVTACLDEMARGGLVLAGR